MSGRFRLRLDIGIDGSRSRERDANKPMPSSSSATVAAPLHDGKRCCSNDVAGMPCTTSNHDYQKEATKIRPEFDIAYDERTTFANVLRDIIETHFMGGHILDYLMLQQGDKECINKNSQMMKNDKASNISDDGNIDYSPNSRKRKRMGRRDEVYVLMYSKEDATMVQPYWSSHTHDNCSVGSSGNVGHHGKNSVRHLMLQLSTAQKTIKPHDLVSSFVHQKRHSMHDLDGINTTKYCSITANGGCKKQKLSNIDDYKNDYYIDMKLMTTRVDINAKDLGKKSSKQSSSKYNINVLLCEEHWRQSGKLLSWNLLYKPKASTKKSSVTSNHPAKNCSNNESNVNCASSTKKGDQQGQKQEHHHPALKSFLIHNFLGNNKILMAMAFLIPTKLILRGLDMMDGIQMSVDKPLFCQARTLNLERPAVLRQYFGLDHVDDSTTSDDVFAFVEEENVVWRSCYGVGSGSRTVGIYPK